MLIRTDGVEIMQFNPNFTIRKVFRIPATIIQNPDDMFRDVMIIDGFIIILTWLKKLLMFDFSQRRGRLMKLLRIQTLEFAYYTHSITTCENNEYFFVVENDMDMATVIKVFKFSPSKRLFIELTSLNVRNLQSDDLFHFNYLITHRGSMILSGLSFSTRKSNFTFKYDIKENSLEEVESERKILDMCCIIQWVSVDKENMKIFGTSNDNKLIELEYLFE